MSLLGCVPQDLPERSLGLYNFLEPVQLAEIDRCVYLYYIV